MHARSTSRTATPARPPVRAPTRAPPGAPELRRQLDHHPETRLVALEREPPAVQPCDGGRERQPEAAPFLLRGAAKAHERLTGARAVLRRDARAVVTHLETHAVGEPTHRDLDAPAGGHVLQSVLDQVGEQLREQLPVALHDRSALALAVERESLRSGDRL